MVRVQVDGEWFDGETETRESTCDVIYFDRTWKSVAVHASKLIWGRA